MFSSDPNSNCSKLRMSPLESQSALECAPSAWRPADDVFVQDQQGKRLLVRNGIIYLVDSWKHFPASWSIQQMYVQTVVFEKALSKSKRTRPGMKTCTYCHILTYYENHWNESNESDSSSGSGVWFEALPVKETAWGTRSLNVLQAHYRLSASKVLSGSCMCSTKAKQKW